MKRRVTAVILMLLLLMSVILPASAETYFVGDDGSEYAWVKGLNVKPSRDVEGFHWEKAYGDDRKQITQAGQCEYFGRNHLHTDACDVVDCGYDYEHVCNVFCNISNVEYMWILVPNEVMSIASRNRDGDAIVDCKFILLKQKIKTDTEGNFLLDDAGNLQYESSETVASGIVDRNGIAAMRLDETLLDPDAPFHRFVLGQILDGSLGDQYRPLDHRWYVTVVRNADDEYEVYSITQAPAVNPTKQEDLPENYGKLGEAEFVTEYNRETDTLTVTNDFRLGSIGVVIEVTGFDGTVPSQVKPTVTIKGNNVNESYISNGTLRDIRMGEYTVTASAPVAMEGYLIEEPKITVKAPVEADPVEGNVVLLNREHSNAVVTVTYTYTPLHTHDYAETVIDPTCTENGYTVYTCQDPTCGYTYADNEVAALGHDYESVKKDSSCTTDGYTVHTCTVCGYSYQEDGDAATGHRYTAKVQKPTCTEKGCTIHTCDNCGFSYMDNEVAALGHDYKLTQKIAPTCTETGYHVSTCATCNVISKEPAEAALGHDYKTKEVKSTCTETGYTEYTCTVCDFAYTQNGEAATGHKYTEAVTAPTCTEKGYTVYTCHCGYSYKGNEEAATGHSYTSKVIAPTTEREGYTLHTCSVCRDTYTDNVTDKLTSDKTTDKTDTNKTDTDKNTDKTDVEVIDSANTIVAKAIDDLGRSLKGTEIALYSGDTQICEWESSYENVFVLDELEEFVDKDASATYTLVQTKAPDGYELSEDSFTIKITNRNGKTEADIKKNTSTSSGNFQGNGIEVGNDGTQIVTFRNMRETARIELTCKVEVDFDEKSWVDRTLAAEHQKKEHEFVLTWKDAAGEPQTESVVLSNGEIGLFEAEIPIETEYEIAAVNPDGSFYTVLSENAAGTVTDKNVAERMAVEATVKYTVQADKSLLLRMVVVDAQTNQPLEGAVFELQNPDGLKVGTFTSLEEGELIILDVFKTPGDYLLTQTRAAEGYEAMNGAAPIMVSVSYTLDTAAEKPAVVQSMVAKVAHQAVTVDEEGTYRIVNSVAEEPQEEKGPNVGVLAGVVAGIAVLAAAGTVTAIVLIRKKRKMVDF